MKPHEISAVVHFSDTRLLVGITFILALIFKIQKFKGGTIQHKHNIRTSLVVQWLRLHTSTSRAMALILGQGSSACSPVQQKKKKENFCKSVKIITSHCFTRSNRYSN